MIVNELAQLERFRRIAQYHGLNVIQDEILPKDEIDYLRGQLNAKVYLESESWMLPSWAYLTLKALDKEQAVITEFQNSMYRNWSLIGGVGARKYGLADCRGLITSIRDGGSIDFWLQEGDTLLFPALMGKDDSQLKLVSSDDQVYEWRKYVKAVEFSRTVYHTKKGDVEYVYNDIGFRNHTLERSEFTFYVLVRPMSVLGVEPIEKIEYNSENHKIYVNGFLSLQCDAAPSAIIFGEADDTEFLSRLRNSPDTHEKQYVSQAGLATIALRYDIKLTPAGTQRLFFWSPLVTMIESDTVESIRPVQEDCENTIGEWFNLSNLRADIMFPDEQINTVFAQAVASLAMQGMSVMFPEDPQLAALNWKERMRVLLALLKSGCLTVAGNIAKALSENMNLQDGLLELSTYVPILWGLHQFHEYTQGSTLDEHGLKFLKKLTAGVVRALQPRLVRQPDTSASETLNNDEEVLQHHLVVRPDTLSDLDQLYWNYAALNAALATISPLHEVELITGLNDAIERSRNAIKERCLEIEQARWLRPTDPIYERIEDEILNLLSTAVLFQRYDIDFGFFERLSSKISSKRIINGLWKSYEPVEKYSSHLSLRIAQFYAVTKQRDKIEPIFERVLEFLSEDYHLPEFVNPRSYGGSGGSGLSVRASADLIHLLYDMMIFEKTDYLVALPGVPEEWFTAKRALVIDRLPLTLGMTHIEIGTSANQHQIEIGLQDFPDEIEIHFPSTIPLSMVKVYGGSIVERIPKGVSPFLKVIPLSDSIVLTFPR